MCVYDLFCCVTNTIKQWISEFKNCNLLKFTVFLPHSLAYSLTSPVELNKKKVKAEDEIIVATADAATAMLCAKYNKLLN